MNKDITKGIETVSVSYFTPQVGTQQPPQNAEIKTLLLPVPFMTGDVAMAAMVKGLEEFYLKPMQEKTGQGIEIDPALRKNLDNLLTHFWKDVDAQISLDAKPNLIL